MNVCRGAHGVLCELLNDHASIAVQNDNWMFLKFLNKEFYTNPWIIWFLLPKDMRYLVSLLFKTMVIVSVSILAKSTKINNQVQKD